MRLTVQSFVTLSITLLKSAANVGYFFYIMAPDMYAGMPGAGIYLAVSEVLVGLKYCKNFYLYCLTNPDIRSAAADLVRKGFGRCKGTYTYDVRGGWGKEGPKMRTN